MMVVAITITNATVMINFLFLLLIVKHKANAITPLTWPEYQHTFSSFDVIGKGLLMILYINGRMYTIIALMKGIAAKMSNPINIGETWSESIESVEAPRYAKTKAYAM